MSNSNQRMRTLDYLRGLAAFSIVVFHVCLFTSGIKLQADDFIQRMGFYGVSIFYILSGLTLYCIYHQRDFSQGHVIWDFFKKRIFRIFPLFIVLTSFVYFVIRKDINPIIYLLNITGLFSILDYDGYIITGGWSIGNELVFYLIFPFLLMSKRDWVFYGLTAVSLVLYVYFSYNTINPTLELSSNWKNYIHPFNQAFLFLSGAVLAKLFLHKTMKNIMCLVLILLGLLLLIFHNAGGGGEYCNTDLWSSPHDFYSGFIANRIGIF